MAVDYVALLTQASSKYPPERDQMEWGRCRFLYSDDPHVIRLCNASGIRGSDYRNVVLFCKTFRFFLEYPPVTGIMGRGEHTDTHGS